MFVPNPARQKLQVDVGNLLEVRPHGQFADRDARFSVDVPHGTRLKFPGLTAEQREALRIRGKSHTGKFVETRKGFGIVFDGRLTATLLKRLPKGLYALVEAIPAEAYIGEMLPA